MSVPHEEKSDRFQRILRWIAVGDALGLACEGMGPKRIQSWFSLEKFSIFGPGRRGVISDDTEQSALVLQCLLKAKRTARSDGEFQEQAVRFFRRSLIGFLLRMPFGIGLGTLRAIVGLLFGRKHGVHSGGNGAAMRAAFMGVVVEDAGERRRIGEAIARLTHTHPLAVAGALWLAEMVSLCLKEERAVDENGRRKMVESACERLGNEEMKDAILAAICPQNFEDSSVGQQKEAQLSTRLPTSGFVLHSMPVVAQDFVLYGDRPLYSLRACIRRGGDTDTHAAMLGALLGAMPKCEDEAEMQVLFHKILPGPFGPKHLDELAAAAADDSIPIPNFSNLIGAVRNLLLMPVVLLHGFARLFPPYG
ncbi:MAG: ADP-ribosylglycohydrolase family protein [Deltaproteobacteria bacterium]|nr:ADP-ribosylglycohydrolase family protein [Deltaproteobacteria bacterium]